VILEFLVLCGRDLLIEFYIPRDKNSEEVVFSLNENAVNLKRCNHFSFI